MMKNYAKTKIKQDDEEENEEESKKKWKRIQVYSSPVERAPC